MTHPIYRTAVRGVFALAISFAVGCTVNAEGTAEDSAEDFSAREGEADNATENVGVAQQALIAYNEGYKHGGNLWAQDYDVNLGVTCPSGYVRDSSSAYETSHGSCSVNRWTDLSDTRDCHVNVHIHDNGWWEVGECRVQVTAVELILQDYSASNTNYAQQNTFNTSVYLDGGRTITVGTCGLSGVWASGDTYLRLVNGYGQTVALNDDACGSLSSNMVYTVPSSGIYVIKAGCYFSGSCSGRVGYKVQ